MAGEDDFFAINVVLVNKFDVPALGTGANAAAPASKDVKKIALISRVLVVRNITLVRI